MPSSPVSLPTDIAALQALVLAQQAQLAHRDTEIERLTLLIAKLPKHLFALLRAAAELHPAQLGGDCRDPRRPGPTEPQTAAGSSAAGNP